MHPNKPPLTYEIAVAVVPKSNLAGLGHVLEASKLAAPGQVRRARRAVSVLADNNLGLGLLVIGDLPVLLGAEDEEHDVSRPRPSCHWRSEERRVGKEGKSRCA